jgi:hypothetical protein
VDKLKELGVTEVTSSIVSYDKFMRTSRMDYDFVYREMEKDKTDVVYLDFFFDDTPEGRNAYYELEHKLYQIPLNLRYVM